MNNKIYLISYMGGLGGEFLSGMIAQDPNFRKPMIFSNEPALNKYYYVDVITSMYNFRQLKTDHSAFQYFIDQREKYQQHLAGKSICICTHADINFNDYSFSDDDIINIVKLNVSFENIAYPLILQIIKNHLLYPVLLDSTSGLEVTKIEQLTYNNYGQVTFENIQKFLRETIYNYIKNFGEFKGTKYLNVYKFLSNPENEMPDWINTFNLSGPLDIDSIKTYHQKNIQLIESTMDLDFKEIMLMNMRALENFISDRIKRHSKCLEN